MFGHGGTGYDMLRQVIHVNTVYIMLIHVVSG